MNDREFSANQMMDAILKYLNVAYNEANASISYAKSLDGNTTKYPADHTKESRSKYDILWGALLLSVKPNESYVVIEFELILDYLERVAILIEKIGEEYKILWKGKVFIENGGFTEEAKLSSQKSEWKSWVEKQNLSNAKRLNHLTLTLSIGTGGLLLFEIYKFYLEHKAYLVHH